MKRIISLIAAVCILGTQAVGAADVSAPTIAAMQDNSTEKKVVITGNTGRANEAVAIDVYKGALADDVDGGDLVAGSDGNLSILVCHDQTTTDTNGDYSFSFNINTGSGLYSVYTGTGEAMLPEYEFLFVNNTAYVEAIGKLNAAATASDSDTDDDNDVKSLISKYQYELGFTPAKLSGVNLDSLANIVFEEKKKLHLQLK